METKKYQLVSIGNFTLTLRGTYREVVSDGLGRPLAPRTIKPLQFVFNNGIPVTVNEEELALIKETRHWGNDLSFHPASLPPDAPKEEKVTSERIAKAVERKLEEKKGRRERAREGSVNPETNESFES